MTYVPAYIYTKISKSFYTSKLDKRILNTGYYSVCFFFFASVHKWTMEPVPYIFRLRLSTRPESSRLLKHFLVSLLLVFFMVLSLWAEKVVYYVHLNPQRTFTFLRTKMCLYSCFTYFAVVPLAVIVKVVILSPFTFHCLPIPMHITCMIAIAHGHYDTTVNWTVTTFVF